MTATASLNISMSSAAGMFGITGTSSGAMVIQPSTVNSLMLSFCSGGSVSGTEQLLPEATSAEAHAAVGGVLARGVAVPAAVGRDLAGPGLRAVGSREVGRAEALAAVAVDKAAQVTSRAQGRHSAQA